MNANSFDNPGRIGGNREDLGDILTIIEPEGTPITSLVKKGVAPLNTLSDWLADTLRKPRLSGTKEGQDAGKGNNKVKNRTRLGTYVQRIFDNFSVTDVQEKISQRGGTAAISNEYANSKAKTIREMKRDIEAICCSSIEHNGGNEYEMKTRGAFCWLDATNTLQKEYPVNQKFQTLPGSVLSNVAGGTGGMAQFSEDQFYDLLGQLKTVYGEKRTYQGIVGNHLQKQIDRFTRTSADPTETRYKVQENASEHKITMMVSVFDCSMGRVELLGTEFNNVGAEGAWNEGIGDPNAGLILNMDLWSINFFDALHTDDLPDMGGGPNGYAKAMFQNRCLNPKGNGCIFDKIATVQPTAIAA